MKSLDCIGMSCPLPIVRISQTFKKTLEIGDQLTVTANDPAFKIDLEAWSKKTGHIILDFTQDNGVFCTTLEKCPQK